MSTLTHATNFYTKEKAMNESVRVSNGSIYVKGNNLKAIIHSLTHSPHFTINYYLSLFH
jgi:hypothetical protein